MKTAKELFEALGYKRHESENGIQYFSESGVEITFIFLIRRFYKQENFQSLNISVDEFKAIQQQMKELGWVEEEKQKIKEENNFGHYRYEILDIFIDNLAMYGKELCKCDEVDCSVCSFNNGRGSCRTKRNKWLNQPYENPTYQLTQFEFDLLNAYKNSGMRQCISNYGTLLEMYGKGHFKGIDTSTPIHEILDNCKMV